MALLTLDQPERRNALSDELARDFREQLAAVRAEPAVRSLVVTGAGTAFCAGADLGSLAQGAGSAAQRRALLGEYYRTFLDLRSLPLPTVAAVNGAAIGAGLNLALCCDLRIMAEGAHLAAPFLRLGIHPGGGATWMLSRLSPAGARELLLLGEPVAAPRALALGLVTRVLPASELETGALELARALAGLPRSVMANLLQALEMAERGDSLEAVLAFETAAQAESLASEDAREGWAAARERRAPHFSDA